MRLDGLLEVRVRSMLPELLRPVSRARRFLLPVTDEEVLVLLYLGIIHFWEVPLVRVRPRNTEVKKSFLRWLGDPVHTVVDAHLRLALLRPIVNTKPNSLKLLVLFVAALVLSLSPRLVLFDELGLEVLVDLLLLFLSLLRLGVLIIVLPRAAHELLVASDVVLRILQLRLLGCSSGYAASCLAPHQMIVVVVEGLWLDSRLCLREVAE